MATTKASRKAKRQSYGKGNDSDSGSAIIKARKAHDSKEAITKGAVKKSDENAKAKQTREYVANAKAKQAQAKQVQAKQAQAKQTREYVLKKKDKPLAQNGRKPGRQLIRWSVFTDQILLLIVDYELKRHGIVMPWDAIAKRLACEKETTGACVQQHLTKLRKEMLARGSWVPPLSGKPGNKYPDGDVRGYVMVKKRNNESEIREVLWTEDAFRYVDLVHINKAKMFETTMSPENGEGTSGSARQMIKANGSAADLSDDEMDPADLPSEEEFDPSIKKSKLGGRVTRSFAKLGRHSKGKSYDSDADADADGESDSEFDVKREREPVMMALYQSDEEEQVSPGMVILRIAPHLLARFPQGINQTYTQTPGTQVGNNNTLGEEVDGDDALDSSSYHPANTAENYYNAFYGGDNSGDGDYSGHGDNSGHGQPYSVLDANTPENFFDAFGNGQPYSVMDANTPENYLSAVMDHLRDNNGRPYSVMDANTPENYFGAFGGGDNSGGAPQDGDDPDHSNPDDFDSNGDQRGNTATGNSNLLMAQSSNQVTPSGRIGPNGNMIGPARQTTNNSHSNRNSMSHQANNQQVGQVNSMGNIQGLNTANNSHSNRNSMSHQANNQQVGQVNSMGNIQGLNTANNSSGQFVHAVNGIGYNPRQTPHGRELLMGAFANNAPAENHDNMTFAQIIAERQALLRADGANSGNGFVMGNTTSPANDPFVSNRARSNNQMGGVQTGTENNLRVPTVAVNGNSIYQNNADVPMNGYEMDGGNNENVTPEPDDNQHPSQGFMDGFEDFYGYADDVLPFGNY